MVTIATWNVNSLRVRLAQVCDWLTAYQPDILALQEIKLEDQHFPIQALEALGYQALFAGQKTYNGVALLSKIPAFEPCFELSHWPDPQRRILAATIQGIRVINLYVPNGSSLESPKYQYKLTWMQNTAEYLKQQLALYPYLVVVGDFNVAPEDRDVYDPAAWLDQVLVSEPERQALQNWADLGLQDTFRLFEKDAGHYSWWDYRAAAFRRNLGMRIDHIWASNALAATAKQCVIDKIARAAERPSDHAPMIAQFDIDGIPIPNHL